jgi:glutamate synthase (ferredoxin)
LTHIVIEQGAHLIHLDSPVLNQAEMDRIATFAEPRNGGFKQHKLST